jgi:pheromone alpha factor receptor
MASTIALHEFNLWIQPVTLYNEDGSTFTVNMGNVDEIRLYAARLGITYGTQIGASLLLLLVLLLLTRASKRKSCIFLINALSLAANTIRCILLSCYVTSTMLNPYSQLSGNYSRVTREDLATSTAANVFTLMVTVLVMVSLSLQVRVVCITTAPVQRYFIMGTTTVMACIAIGYKAAFVVLNIKQTLNLQSLQPYGNVVLASYITQAVAIWLFSCVFTYKLGYAIIQRRKLKMPQFGPMQIVFIMGCQTMLIPGTLPPHILFPCALLTQPSRLRMPPIPPRHHHRTRCPISHHGLHLPPAVRHLGWRRQ